MSMRLSEFHLAISFKNLSLIKHLMRDGLALNLDRMWRGETPVGRAVNEEAYEILEYLVLIGAEVNVRSQDDRMEPPLFAACRRGSLRAVHILLQAANLNIDQRDFFNRTPLWAAVRSLSLEMVELLLDHGADISAVQRFNECPLILSMLILRRTRDPNIAVLLIKRGCLLDFKSPEGSALYYSVIFANRELFRLLVYAGCSVKNEEWLSINNLPQSWKNDEKFCQWICSLPNNPHSLVHLTSCVIRRLFVKLHKNIFPSHITQLLLPKILHRRLLLED